MTETNHRNKEKSSIKSLLIVKYEYLKSIDDFTTLINKKAKEINLTTRERTELILEARRECKQ